MEIHLRALEGNDREDWLQMRKGLWPEAPEEYLRSDMDKFLAEEPVIVLLAWADGRLAGMIETRLRNYADGCETSPVGYIEGWFVYPDYRGTGVAGALVRAAEDWARQQGCQEMASDTWLDNGTSIRAHMKLGYDEVDKLIHFAKRL